MYSIQSGKPRKSAGLFGEFKKKSVRYAPIGALIGAGYGVISEDDGVVKSSIKGAGIGILLAALDTALSYFRRKEVRSSSADDVISRMRSKFPITPNDYTVNSDPYSSKVSVAISGGIMVMYLNNLTDTELLSISDNLDEAAAESRYADYKSEKTDKGYLVTVVLPSIDNVCDILVDIINNLGIKINIVSKVSQSNRSFSSLKDKYNEMKNTDRKSFLKSILKKNKVVKNMESVTPGVVDEMIDNMSVDPLIKRYEDMGIHGENIVKGLKE